MLVAELPSIMLVYLRDGSAQTIIRAATTEVEAADPTFYLTQSQYIDTGPTSPSADPITPGAWQGSHLRANFEVTGRTRPGKIPSQAGFEPRIFRSRGGRLNHKANEADYSKGHFFFCGNDQDTSVPHDHLEADT